MDKEKKGERGCPGPTQGNVVIEIYK